MDGSHRVPIRTLTTPKLLSRHQRLRPRIAKEKLRDLRYASHRDAAVFSYYAYKLQANYEKKLADHKLEKCVIGYRSGLGSNIDLAADAFSDISSLGNVTALCFDIENFFPSIKHCVLKSNLQEVLSQPNLSNDWYNVFRNASKYAYIEIDDLAQSEGFSAKAPPFPLVASIPDAMKRCRAAKIVKRNKNDHDVPQGTPISAALANVSMLGFDLAISQWATQNGASYRRYSDDILLLVPPNLEAAAHQLVCDEAKSIHLTINAAKTEVSRFTLNGRSQLCDRPITYLGFSFDGEQVSLRQRTLSRYYRRMTYAARHSVRMAGQHGGSAKNAFKRSLIRDFTHLGRRNFYSYAKRADKKFENSIVKRQLRRHFKILLRKLANKGR